MSPDLCNGLFESFGALFLFGNVLKLRQDREVKGVDWRAVAFFFAWGCWNLFYYSHLNQPCSFCGGILIATMNLIWLAHVAYYWFQARQPVALDLRPITAAEIQAE